MKLGVSLVLAIAILSFSVAATEHDLECSIKAACSGLGETEVFAFYGLNPGGQHAELPEQTYVNKVCCHVGNGQVVLNSSCSAAYKTEILRLASQTNSHVEFPTQSNYANTVCLGSNQRDLNIQCTYDNINTCLPGWACLGSTSSAEQGDAASNLHVANCSTNPSEAYTYKICCIGNAVSDSTYIYGTITDSKTGQPIKGANVSYYSLDDPMKPLVSKLTNALGKYLVNISSWATKPITLLNGVARFNESYALVIKENVSADFDAVTMIDYELKPSQGCKEDCTMVNDPYHLCNPDCDGVADCSFYDSTTKAICTVPQQAKGLRKVIDDDGENETVVYCCESAPLIEKKGQVSAEVSCPEENVVKLTRIVIIDGEPVKMNVVSCSK